MITKEQLRAIMPQAKQSNIDLYSSFLDAAMIEFEINTPARAAAFLAQLAHESGQFTYMEEIASGKAYEGRRDLGNTQPGDGKRFKGRGAIQITGRANYQKYGAILGLDLINLPEMAANKEVGFRLAGAFWKTHGLNELADQNSETNFKAITRKINGGYNGLADRQQFWARAKKELGA